MQLQPHHELDSHLESLLQHIGHLRQLNLTSPSSLDDALSTSLNMLGALTRYRHGLKAITPEATQPIAKAA